MSSSTTEPRAPLSPAAAAAKTSAPVAPLSPAEAAAGVKAPTSAPLSPAELAAKDQAASDEDDDAPPDVSGLEKLKEPPPKTIGEGFEKRTLRKLTPEEKDARRAKWNAIMALIGVVVLIGVAMALMRM